jgi:hypothetical protein
MGLQVLKKKKGLAALELLLLGFKPRSRQIDQAIKHPTNPSLMESTAAQDCPTDSDSEAQAVQ